MKRNYCTPTLEPHGDAREETRSGAQQGNEVAQPFLKFKMT